MESNLKGALPKRDSSFHEIDLSNMPLSWLFRVLLRIWAHGIGHLLAVTLVNGLGL